ncbi:MAG: hypothetical protein ABI175_05095, partial [Polyangiales bacterium]
TVLQRGFLDRVDEEQCLLFENALVGLYKMAGVDLVREQIDLCVDGSPYDIADEGLVVWPGADFRSSAVYDLSSRRTVLRPRGQAPSAAAAPPIPTRDLFFARQELTWKRWVAAWMTDGPKESLVRGPRLLGRAP